MFGFWWENTFVAEVANISNIQKAARMETEQWIVVESWLVIGYRLRIPQNWKRETEDEETGLILKEKSAIQLLLSEM